jgi:hypothetical protein
VNTSTPDAHILAVGNALAPAFGTNHFSVHLKVTSGSKLRLEEMLGIPGSFTVTSAANVTGATHHVAAVGYFDSPDLVLELFMDGASQGTVALGGAISNFAVGPDLYVGGFFGATLVPEGLLSGTVSHVAVYDKALDPARIEAHADAGLNGFASESSDERIARIARWAGIPDAQLDLEPGLSVSISAATDVSGKPPVEAMQDIASTESGVLFIAADGRLTFQSRAHRYNAVSALSIDGADIGEDAVLPGNDAFLVNDVTASRPGGITARFVNQASLGDYGTAKPPGGDLVLLTTSDNEVASAASWKANVSADPTSPRLPNLSVDILTNSAIADDVLGLELGDRITLDNLPDQAPVTELGLFIEGWTETISSQEWRFSFNASPADQSEVWVLSDEVYSVLGSTTRLAY